VGLVLGTAANILLLSFVLLTGFGICWCTKEFSDYANKDPSVREEEIERSVERFVKKLFLKLDDLEHWLNIQAEDLEDP
jgi:hypothetical protein